MPSDQSVTNKLSDYRLGYTRGSIGRGIKDKKEGYILMVGCSMLVYRNENKVFLELLL